MKKLIAASLAVAFAAAASPASAHEIAVTVTNSATVTNTVTSNASTGGNSANGGVADNLITGGNVSESEYGNQAGNKDTTVLGGLGGMIETGDAEATAHVENRINTNRTRIVATPWETTPITVDLSGTIALETAADAAGSSGDNAAHGSDAVNTIEGGNVDSSGSSNVGGNGGGHIEAGNGGAISTGSSISRAHVVNVLNKNVTRIRK